MQTQINLSEYGIELPESYSKIGMIRIEHKKINFTVEVYSSKDAYLRRMNPMKYENYNIGYDEAQILPGTDLIAKLYAYVKASNPIYQNAIEA